MRRRRHRKPGNCWWKNSDGSLCQLLKIKVINVNQPWTCIVIFKNNRNKNGRLNFHYYDLIKRPKLIIFFEKICYLTTKTSYIQQVNRESRILLSKAFVGSACRFGSPWNKIYFSFLFPLCMISWQPHLLHSPCFFGPGSLFEFLFYVLAVNTGLLKNTTFNPKRS